MTVTCRVRLTKIGWDDDLLIETHDEVLPTLVDDEVRIEVEACGVCQRDCIDRAGRFKFIQTPITPGHEAVGRVTAVGPATTDWAVGDRVGTMHRNFCGRCLACTEGNTSLCENATAALGLIIDGGYASHLVAPERCFFRVPDGVPAAQAAVLHCTFGTAYRGLKRAGRVQPGHHVLITGANGGVGTAAIQVARRLGATVTAVVRSENQRAYVTDLGANDAIVDSGDAFHKRLSNGLADVVMECVGSPTFNASLRSLRPGGRMIVVGNIVEEPASLNLGYVVTKALQVIGSSGAARVDMKEMLEMHEAQPFTIHIHDRMNLADADRAQRQVRAGGLRGRIVLVPASG